MRVRIVVALISTAAIASVRGAFVASAFNDEGQKAGELIASSDQKFDSGTKQSVGIMTARAMFCTGDNCRTPGYYQVGSNPEAPARLIHIKGLPTDAKIVDAWYTPSNSLSHLGAFDRIQISVDGNRRELLADVVSLHQGNHEIELTFHILYSYPAVAHR